MITEDIFIGFYPILIVALLDNPNKTLYYNNVI